MVLPPQVLVDDPAERQPLVYVVSTPSEVAAESGLRVVERSPGSGPRSGTARPFLAGVLMALLLGGIAWGGGYVLLQPEEAQRQLAATLPALPQTLSGQQLKAISQSAVISRESGRWLEATAQQLKSLEALAPEWRQQYGRQLVGQAERLWPDDPQTARLAQRWQRQQAAQALPDAALTGWHDGMQQLRTLADRLNGLDGQKGKYITVSELKTEVFSMLNHFGAAIPAEEQLRLLEQLPPGQPASAVQYQQLREHLQALNTRLAAGATLTGGE